MFKLIPNSFKITEIAVKDYINSTFYGFQRNSSLSGNCECSHKRKIDQRKMFKNILLCIKTDEEIRYYLGKYLQLFIFSLIQTNLKIKWKIFKCNVIQSFASFAKRNRKTNFNRIKKKELLEII